MILPIECACGQNGWYIPVGKEFDGKIYTTCCITTLHIAIETIEYSV